MVLFVAGSCVRLNRTLGGLGIQGGGQNDWLKGVGHERFLEKPFGFLDLEVGGKIVP